MTKHTQFCLEFLQVGQHLSKKTLRLMQTGANKSKKCCLTLKSNATCVLKKFKYVLYDLMLSMRRIVSSSN